MAPTACVGTWSWLRAQACPGLAKARQAQESSGSCFPGSSLCGLCLVLKRVSVEKAWPGRQGALASSSWEATSGAWERPARLGLHFSEALGWPWGLEGGQPCVTESRQNPGRQAWGLPGWGYCSGAATAV